MNNRALACAALLLFPASVAFSQTVQSVPAQQIAGAIVVECPPFLGEPGRGVVSGVPMQFENPTMPTPEFLATIPQGWNFKKAQTYSGQRYEALSHEINQNRMDCLYGRKNFSPPSGTYFVLIERAIPANQACKAVSGLKFECRPKPVMLNK